MSRKTKYSIEQKVEACKRYLAGESAMALAAEYAMPRTGEKRIRGWSKYYETYGEAAFKNSAHNKAYSKELKDSVIQEYMSGVGSIPELAVKYNISSPGIVSAWIKRYNNGIENRDYSPKHEVYAMKSRKTTLEERIEIVKYAVDNGNDYKGAAEKYSVPYANVYQWVRKYSQDGEKGLSDRRGKKAQPGAKRILTEEEKKDAEIEKLRKELERANMVIEVLKKKNELEEKFLRDSRSFARDFRTKRSKNSKK